MTRELPKLIRNVIQCGNCGGAADSIDRAYGGSVCPCGETQIVSSYSKISVYFGAKGFTVIEP